MALFYFPIDTIKAAINAQGGVAFSNQFSILLPSLAGRTTASGESTSSLLSNRIAREGMNLLCSAANLPGKQIVTNDRMIGMDVKKTAYGYAYSEVNLTFTMTNLYTVKRYFDEWQSLAISREEPYVAGYYDDYVADVEISQVAKQAPVGLSVYKVKLIDAFPTTVGDISFSNDLNGLSELSVSLSFRTWEQDESVLDTIGGIIDDIF